MALPTSFLSRTDTTKQTIAAGVTSGSPNAFGATWFVDATNGADTNTGLDPSSARATIASAITSSIAGDTFILSPEEHTIDVSAAAMTPKANQCFVGAIKPYGSKPSTSITADTDDGADLVLVDVDGVVFDGIEFKLVAGGTTALRLIAVSQTTAVNGLTIRDCWFDLNDVDVASLFAIAIHDATNATTGVVITGCRFHGGNTTTTRQANYIQVGVGGLLSSIIEENTFELQSVDGDTYGIHFLDNAAAANKSYCTMIRNNDFFGPLDAGTDGIGVFVNSSLTELEILAGVRTNYFPFCTNSSGTGSITIDKLNEGIMQNYVGDDATGGTVVDPGT